MRNGSPSHILSITQCARGSSQKRLAARIDYDHEVVATGTILHDIGLTARVSGPNRFEVNSADAALSFVKGEGLSDRRAQLIRDLVALNSTHRSRFTRVG